MDVKLPKLGEGADSGVVVSILVNVGDAVTEGQTIIELENEKAVAPIPSSASGTISAIHVKEGDTLSVGQVILTVSGSATAPAAKPTTKKAASKAAAAPATPAPTPAPAPAPAAPVDSSAFLEKPAERIAASPAIRKLARDLGIDLTRVRGTERGGRIGMADVRTYVQTLQARAFQPAAAAAASGKASREVVDYAKYGKTSRKQISQLRRIIAERMVASVTTAPQVTQFDEADISGLMDLRKRYVAAYEAKGARLTLTSFALKAIVHVLQQHPIFNASLDEITGDIVFKEYYHIGLAVDTDAGLLVPVIRDADQKDLVQLSKEIEELAAKARERRLALEEMKGGSFTISNHGGIGSAHFTPIVNLPEAAILGLGRGALKAVVRNKNVETRLMLPLALSYDHRLIDGGTAARFMVDLVQAFEQFPEKDLKLK